ncbi:MAG: hypothetical protein QGI68_13360 [Pseudomonadales bacterium]|nr:hypothetical protein [Pseudomonadales bacterium]HJN51358.1 hypothetical protein [Pseudomonadales bacterium]
MPIAIPRHILNGEAGLGLAKLIKLIESRPEMSDRTFAGALKEHAPEALLPRLEAALRRAFGERTDERVTDVQWGDVTEEKAGAFLILKSGDRLGMLTRAGAGGGPIWSLVERIPAGVTVREAVPDDGPALREIERTTPMAFSGGAVTYDKGDDYFAQDRLKEHGMTFVIEVEGKTAGLFKIAQRRLHVAGEVRHFTYAHRHRVAPWAQGRGLHYVINFLTYVETPPGATRYDLIRSDHSLTRNMAAGSSWSVLPARVLIDTEAHASTEVSVGRSATRDDANVLVDLFNETHGDKALFVPYGVPSLAGRLSRSPDDYTWGEIRLGHGAAVGIWPADWQVAHRTEGRQVTDRRAIVLDYGVRSGALAEFIDLLRAACTEMAARGITEISIFTTQGDLARESLLGMGKAVEPYRLLMPWPEPPNLAAKGIYLDQIYL